MRGLLFERMDRYLRSLWYIANDGIDSYSLTVYCHVIVCMQPYSNDLINNNTKSRCIEAKLKGKLLNAIGNNTLHWFIYYEQYFLFDTLFVYTLYYRINIFTAVSDWFISSFVSLTYMEKVLNRFREFYLSESLSRHQIQN